MSVLRQLNVLGQQRLDVPHIRSIESAVAADFDVLAGRVQAGGKAVVIRGFTLANFTAGTNATSIQLSTADGILYNMNSSESGTFLWVPADRATEVLNSATNGRVQGGFTAGQINYIGLDLVRTADDTTSDLVQFLDPNTLLEQAKNVPLARTLDYKIIISTTPFSASSNIIPIAKVKTDNQNQVDTAVNAVEDARNLMWRLGSGGDFPSIYNTFTWAQNRLEYDPNVGALSTLDKFAGGDKGITSQKDWMDAVMMRLWEIGGGQNWYSPTGFQNVKMVKVPAIVFSSTGDNFEWVAGLYSSNHLHWQGLKIVFENANVSGVYYNNVQDQTSDDPTGSAATSKTALAIGDCIYVDLDRTSNATVVAKKAAIQTLGTPAIPGSRIILAWRETSGSVFVRDSSFPVNTSFTPATPTSLGSVRLSRNYTGTLATPAGSNATPIVISDRGGVIQSVAGSNLSGLTVTGDGTGHGLVANSSANASSSGLVVNGSGGHAAIITSTVIGALALQVFGAADTIVAQLNHSGTGSGLQITGSGTGTGLIVNSNGPGASITTAGASSRALDISAVNGQGIRVTNSGSGAGIQINKTGSGTALDIQATGSTGFGLQVAGNSSAVTLAINSHRDQWADFQGGPGDGFTTNGGMAARFTGGSAGSNPVSGSMSGGDGVYITAGQGFGHNNFAFGGGPGGMGLLVTGGKGGDIVASGTGFAGDGGVGITINGGAGGDNASSSGTGNGGTGLIVNGGNTGSGSNPQTGGKAIVATAGSGGNADAIWAFGTGNGTGILATGGSGIPSGSVHERGAGVYGVGGSGDGSHGGVFVAGAGGGTIGTISSTPIRDGVVGIGRGTGAGGVFIGGGGGGTGVSGEASNGSNGVGGWFVGKGTGSGVRGDAGGTAVTAGDFYAAGAYGSTAIPGSIFGVGVLARGHFAVVGSTGTNSNGAGVYAWANASNNQALLAINNSSGYGAWIQTTSAAGGLAAVNAYNNSVGPGLNVRGGSLNDDARPAAIIGAASGGGLKMAGGNPNTNTGYSNTLMPINIIKAWGYVAIQTTYTLVTGFNIASITTAPLSGGLSLQVDLTTGANAADRLTAVVTAARTSSGGYVYSAAADLGVGNRFFIGGYRTNNTQIDFDDGGIYHLNFIVMGPQN